MAPRPHTAVLVGLVALVLAALLPRPAEASFLLEVTYGDASVVSGPLSFGLVTLPAMVDASFQVGPGSQGSEPPIRNFAIGDVISASISFGDGTWTLAQLNSFTMRTINGVPSSLLYDFNGILTPTVNQVGLDRPVLNFPLTITGTDIASGRAFEYNYASSTQTLTAIPEPATYALFLIGLAGLGVLRRRFSPPPQGDLPARSRSLA